MTLPGNPLDAFREGAFGAAEVLFRAAARSGEEARDVYGTAGSPLPAFAARLGELARAQWPLWAWATLAAGERFERATSGAAPPGSLLPSPRTLALGAASSELYLGYAALRERQRWFPGLVDAEDWEIQHRRGAGRAFDAAVALGGSLIKAGQFASTRPDLLPWAYVGTLSKLQDSVPPRPRRLVEEDVSREIGAPLSEVFSGFGEPLAAASIAQVHRARLRDGREVAVKVRHPGIEAMVEADLRALEDIFEAISRLEPTVRLRPIADYLRWTLPLELDFRREARSMEDLREALADRADVVVPAPIGGLVTEGLIVMEYVEGTKVTDRQALVEAGIEPREVARLLNDVYADQLFGRGILHADPHPGNLLVLPGPRLAILDHGLTLALEPSFVAALEKTVGAMRSGDLDELTGALEEAGLPVGEETDLDTLLGLVGVLLGGEWGETGLGDLGRNLGASVGGIPPRLLLAGRAIGLLDGITRQLDPDFDALEVVARHT